MTHKQTESVVFVGKADVGQSKYSELHKLRKLLSFFELLCNVKWIRR